MQCNKANNVHCSEQLLNFMYNHIHIKHRTAYRPVMMMLTMIVAHKLSIKNTAYLSSQGQESYAFCWSRQPPSKNGHSLATDVAGTASSCCATRTITGHWPIVPSTNEGGFLLRNAWNRDVVVQLNFYCLLGCHSWSFSGDCGCNDFQFVPYWRHWSGCWLWRRTWRWCGGFLWTWGSPLSLPPWLMRVHGLWRWSSNKVLRQRCEQGEFGLLMNPEL